MSYDIKKGLSLDKSAKPHRSDLFDVRLVGSFNFNARRKKKHTQTTIST